MKNTFLNQTIHSLIGQINKNSLLLFPSRRAALLSKKIYLKTLKTPTFVPLFVSIEQLLELLCNSTSADSTLQLMHLYKIMNDKNPELKLPDFLLFGNTLLSDFNLIQEHVEATLYNKIFETIDEIKKIQAWAKEGETLTHLEKEYINNWQGLKEIFNNYETALYQNEILSKGMMLDCAIETTHELIKKHELNSLFVIGFNAINVKEKKVFQTFEKYISTSYYFDADEYYCNNPLHEAGYFIKKSIQEHAPNNRLTAEFKLAKNIEIISCSGSNYQTLVAIDILKSNKINPSETLVVLNDESILPTLCSALFNQFSIENINITMGYKVVNSNVYSFLRLLNTINTGVVAFEIPSVLFIELLSTSIAKLYYNSIEIDEIIKTIVETKCTMVNKNSIVKLKNNPLKTLLTQYFEAIAIERKIEILIEFASDLVTKLSTDYEIQACNAIITSVQNLNVLLIEFVGYLNFSTFFTLLDSSINKLQIALKGNSNEGLQVMGMLETRILDFENVLFLSMNESVIPAPKKLQTFIPFDVLHTYKLPDYSYSQNIFAYHFYRLLQRASNLYLLYNALPSDTTSNEQSRFLTQLEFELPAYNPKINIKKTQYSAPISATTSAPISIVKNQETIHKIIQKFDKKYISASQFTILLQCKLRYYWQYVLGIYQPEQLNDSMTSAEFGSIVHEVLYDIYLPCINAQLDTNYFENCKKNANNLLKAAYEKKYNNIDMKTGEQLLLWEKSLFFITSILSQEIKKIKKSITENIDYKIIYLEQKFEASIAVNKNLKVNIGGVFDRIEKWGDTLYICDYKTGSFKLEKVTFDTFESLHKEGKKYVVQLLFYILLFKENAEFNATKLTSAINFLGDTKIEKVNLIDKEKNSIYSNNPIVDGFKEKIKNEVKNLLDINEPIAMTDDADNCSYCQFNTICKRKPKSWF
jgi:RecB family exonuclease